MKKILKNVLKGLVKEYCIEEVNIITPERVVFSGTIEQWKATTDDMKPFKRKVEECEVTDRKMFNKRKAFIFIHEPDTYYPLREEEKG